ncbi:TonB-dependent receptor [Massilia sp. BJB1822]|uniref:TonB-dependent receptor n=1 Tax=Massilia sp. BJB1822 TaxID=2744470 RepID=UPI0015940343|nr:TonB-dependent receptor [Massilia sp. BJB1822]NVE00055.1 TonB-dependent receptor [Massilia sp. BJB1822]
MSYIVSRRALAAAVSLCFAAAPALAQTATQTLGPVVVTGSRFDSNPGLAPIGATVISAADIRRAGASDVNQAIRKIGGVYGRQALDGSPNFGLDLRGFGSNSSQNMVVLVDGVRISENELTDAIMSSIPIDSVERIEITRGGSSVLYGDGATGGVIRIVTKRPAGQGTHGSVFAEAGQFGLREARGSVSHSWDGFALDASLGALDTDNYRDNNDYKKRNFTGGAQWTLPGGRIGVRTEILRQDGRLPGSLNQAEFEATPRKTNEPHNFGSVDSDRYIGFYEQKFGAFDLAAELAHRKKDASASYFYGGKLSTTNYDTKQTQFSPRLRHTSQFGAMQNEVVTGIDLMRWNRVVDGSFSKADATQRSKAFYVRDEMKWAGPHEARLAFGARRELFDIDSVDPAPYSTANYSDKRGLNAWEIQGSYAVLPELTLHAKAGQSYRVANADENGFTPKANVALKAQTSHDLELGASFALNGYKLAARVFKHELNNEIYYDPTATPFGGANSNLPPTRRKGIEFDASARLAADWQLSGHYQHVKAEFTEGALAGKELVLVPKNVLSARLAWTPSSGQSADVGMQWVDSQRYGGDFLNTCNARMPSFTTFDARYARQYGPWEVAVSGQNLGDKRYTTAAFSCRDGIYPSDGRQLKLSARYDF